MGAATPHSVFGSAASHFRIPFRVLRRRSAGKDDELEQGAAGVWAGDGGLDRLATPPRAGRVLASSTPKGIPGARYDPSARCGPWLCSLPVTAQLHCNQPQPGSSETQILHKSRQRAAPPVALVHIWRLNPSTGGDAGAGGTPRRTRYVLLFGPPATAEWSSVDLPTWRGRLWLPGLVPCGRSIPLE